MNFYDVLREAAKREEKTLTFITDAIGKHDSYISGAIGRGSIPQIDTAVNLLAPLGYKLYAIKETETIPEAALEITAAPMGTKDELLEKKQKS